MINNTNPGFLANGEVDTAGITDGSSVPPSSLRTIGDALNEKGISWVYYGGGFNAAVRFTNGSTDPFDVLIGTGGNFYCEICNPFQYAARSWATGRSVRRTSRTRPTSSLPSIGAASPPSRT
jgi:phospholipase C